MTPNVSLCQQIHETFPDVDYMKFKMVITIMAIIYPHKVIILQLDK